MHISTLVSRDTLSSEHLGIFNTTCTSGTSWLCPVDIVLWILLIGMVALVCWKMYITNRVGPGSPGQRSLTRSKRQRYWHLEVPYPSDPNSEPSYGEKKYTHESDNERREGISGSTSTLVDPYHVVTNLDASLISKDSNFNHTSVPAPVLERKTTGKLAGLGLGIHMQNDSSIPAIPGGPVQSGDNEKVHEGVNVEKTLTPPQAHVHNSRWDT